VLEGVSIGSLGLGFSSVQDFDPAQLAFFEAMVRHIASALERTRLLEEALSLLAERTEVAEGLQSSLLPPSLPDLRLARLAVRYHPEGSSIQVGGDFYDVFPLAENRWLVAVGDVEGRGVEAAAVTGLVRHSLRSLMLTGATPSEALRHVNELLRAQTDDPGVSRPTRFCSVAAAVVEVGGERVTMQLALAGHPQPLIAGRDGIARPVGILGGPLGALERPALADCFVELAPGQAIVMFTDGVTERRSGGHFFGEDGIARAVSGAHSGDAEELATALDDAVRDFAPGELSDDVVILVLAVPARLVAAGAVAVGPDHSTAEPAAEPAGA
jgi:serine phosphatase RsbU (regulator of sigma subunit)